MTILMIISLFRLFRSNSLFYLIKLNYKLFKMWFNSSLHRSVEIKTSWAVFPFLAIALYPLIVFTDNLIINFEDLPLTLDITAGVIVLILVFKANFWSTGIRPSIFVLWFKTNLANFNFSWFYSENFDYEKLILSKKSYNFFELLLYLK